MVLANEKTPLQQKLATILNLISCENCTNKDIVSCEVKKDLDEARYIPLSVRRKQCRYCISEKKRSK